MIKFLIILTFLTILKADEQFLWQDPKDIGITVIKQIPVMLIIRSLAMELKLKI